MEKKTIDWLIYVNNEPRMSYCFWDNVQEAVAYWHSKNQNVQVVHRFREDCAWHYETIYVTLSHKMRPWA